MKTTVTLWVQLQVARGADAPRAASVVVAGGCAGSAVWSRRPQSRRAARPRRPHALALRPHTHRTTTRTTHYAPKRERRRGRVPVAEALVARAGGGAGVDGAAGAAGRGHAGGGHRAAHAPRARLRLRRGAAGRRLRPHLGRAHEPCRHARRAHLRRHRLGARHRVRRRPGVGRYPRVRAADGVVGQGRRRQPHGVHVAGRAGGGGGGHGGASDGLTGAAAVRPVGGARRPAPRPRRAAQGRPRHRRTRLRRGPADRRQPQPREELRPGAAERPLGPPLGVLGGPAVGRRAGGAAAPLRAARACAASDAARRGAAAARQGVSRGLARQGVSPRTRPPPAHPRTRCSAI